MRRLILVKHSLPQIVPGKPAPRWHLSDEGRRRGTLLADRLAIVAPCLFWQGPGLPSFVALSLPDLQVQDVCLQVA